MSKLWDIEKEAEINDFNYDFNQSATTETKELKNHYLELKKSTKLRENASLKDDENVVKVSRKDYFSDSEEEEFSVGGGEESDGSDMQDADSSSGSENESEEDDEEGSDNESDQGSGEGDEEEGELARLKKQELEEQKHLQSLKRAELNDKEKGKAVKKQLETWDFLLDMRIKMQKGFEKAITLPTSAFGYKELVENDNDLSAQVSDLSASLTELFDDLTNIQLNLLDDEVMPKKDRKRLSKKRNCDEMKEWFPATFEKVIEPMEKELESHTIGVIEKWNEKVQASSGFAMQKKFKVINQSFSALYSQLSNDKDRLIKRTRLNRSSEPIIGMPVVQKSDSIPSADEKKGSGEYNAHIFNDDDFYQQILKEFIDSRISDTSSTDPSSLGAKYAQLRSLQGKKNKKTVDTRASKGRKIRYHVHEKIQNYMAPEPVIGSWHEEKAVELYASLLGGVQQDGAREEKVVTVSDGFKLF